MSIPWYNEAIYEELPPAEAEHQLAHIHESRANDLIVSHFVCLVIAVVAIGLRFLSRRMSKTPIKADDWMIVAALVFALGYIISVLLCIMRYGGGRHAILLTDPVKFAQSVLAAEVFYAPAIACVKISTLFLFTRIFPGRGFRILLHTVGTFVTLYSGIMVLTAIFQCRPMRAAWDVTVKAECIKINLCWMIMAGMNVLTDFILLLAPLPTLWRLQMPRETKLQLMGIFCIGGFVCIISIYRIPKLHGLSLVDASWSNADPTIWSLVEICVAIVCACAIVYRPLVNWIFRIRISLAASAADNDPTTTTSKSTLPGSQKRPKALLHVGSSSGSGKGALVKMERFGPGNGKKGGEYVVQEKAVRSGFRQLQGGEGRWDERV